MEWKTPMTKKNKPKIPIHNPRILTCDVLPSKLKNKSRYLLQNTHDLLLYSIKKAIDLGPLPVNNKKLTQPSAVVTHYKEIQEIFSWSHKILYHLLPLFKMKKCTTNRYHVECSLELYNLFSDFYTTNIINPLQDFSKRLEKYKIFLIVTNISGRHVVMNQFVDSYFKQIGPGHISYKYNLSLGNVNFLFSLFAADDASLKIKIQGKVDQLAYPQFGKEFRTIVASSTLNLNLGNNTYTEYKDIMNSHNYFEAIEK